jgi:hypothetical protein
VTPHHPPPLPPNPFFFFFLLGGCKSKSQLFQKGRKTIFRVCFIMFGKREKNYDWFLFMFGRKEKNLKESIYIYNFFNLIFLGLILLCVWQNFSNTIIKNVQPKYPLSFFLFQKETKAYRHGMALPFNDFKKYPTKIFPYLI